MNGILMKVLKITCKCGSSNVFNVVIDDKPLPKGRYHFDCIVCNSYIPSTGDSKITASKIISYLDINEIYIDKYEVSDNK